ncbi:hypothetical protein [Symbiopectobacterium sp. RP]|uniref:hypothetical protein n=1 Tax=Symbiopectobacterium sp. RP TaxID=3248553 RepID=UPI003D2DFB04
MSAKEYTQNKETMGLMGEANKKVHFDNFTFRNESVSSRVSDTQTALTAPISALDDDDTDFVPFEEFEQWRLQRLKDQVSTTSSDSDTIPARKQSYTQNKETMGLMGEANKKVHFDDFTFRNESVSSGVSDTQTALTAPISALDDDDTDFVPFEEFEQWRLQRLKDQVSTTSSDSDTIPARKQSERSAFSVKRATSTDYDTPRNLAISIDYDTPRNFAISTDYDTPIKLATSTEYDTPRNLAISADYNIPRKHGL